MSIWGSDAPVSMPEPLDPDTPGLVPMGGFVFTEWGLRFDLSEADHEVLRTPTYAPQEPVTEVSDGRS